MIMIIDFNKKLKEIKIKKNEYKNCNKVGKLPGAIEKSRLNDISFLIISKFNILELKGIFIKLDFILELKNNSLLVDIFISDRKSVV